MKMFLRESQVNYASNKKIKNSFLSGFFLFSIGIVIISNNQSFAQYSLSSISGSTSYRATLNAPSPSNNTCNCPTGSVVVGIQGNKGGLVDRITLRCAVLNANGTLGSVVGQSNYNGNSSGGNSFSDNFSGTVAMVGAEIRVGNDLDGIKLIGNTIATIGSSGSNSSSATYLSQQGGTGGTLYTDWAPNGYVIVGMNFKSGPTYAGGVSFNYAKINYTCTQSTNPTSITGTTSICNGSSTTLTASGGTAGTGASFQWYAGGCGSGSVLSTGSTLSVSPTSTTTYFVRRTGTCNTTTCISQTVTVNSLSTAPTGIAGTTSICNGSSTTLTASGGTTGTGASFQWYAVGCGSGSVLSTGSTLSVSPTSTTTYFVRRTGTCNTTTCISQTVTVTTAPNAGTLSGTQTICSNGTTTFTTNGQSGGSWSSSNSGIATVNSSTGNITGVSAGTATITYTVNGSGGCSTATATRTVTVTTTPNAGTLSGTQILCSNGITTFTTNGQSGGFWTSDNTGIATVNSSTGNITGVSAGTATITYVVNGSGGCSLATATATRTVTVSSMSLSYTPNSGDIIWNGSTSSNWLTLNNWSIYNGVSIVNASHLPAQTDNVILTANSTCVFNQPSLSTSVESIKNLTIDFGATLTLVDATLNISGNWLQYGDFIPGTGTVVFEGLSAQEISGTATSFYNLTVNNSTNLILYTPVAISNSLTMLDGNIHTSSSHILTLGINSSALLNWVNGTIVGPFKRWYEATINSGNQTGLFPVGTSAFNCWALVEYSIEPSTSGYLTVEFKASDPSSLTGLLTNGIPLAESGVSINEIMTEGFWEIIPSPTLIGGYYSLTTRANNFLSIINYSGSRIIKSPNNHTVWTLNGSQDTIVGTSTDFTIKRTGMSGFSYFTIAYPTSALPIELISFQANCEYDNKVSVSWATATEHNTSHFIVENSRDGNNWTTLGLVAAAGNSTSMIAYSLQINQILSGLSYFRLSQFDLDGASETFNIVITNCENKSNLNTLKIFPNPSSTIFNLDYYFDGSVESGVIKMIDSKGVLVYCEIVPMKKGNNSFYIETLDAASGIYFIEISAGSLSNRVKHSIH